MSRRAKGWLCVAAGVAVVALLAFMVYRDEHDPAPRFQLPLLVLAGLAAVVLFGLGVSALLGAQRAAADAPEERVSYRHAYRLFGLVGGAVTLALVARGLAMPADFGRFGFYRGGAPADAAHARNPRYLGSKACVECHDDELATHAKDVHRTVQCEDCHGPAAKHVEDPANEHPVVDKSQDACLVCHRKLTARPASFPQVAWRDHFAFVGVKDEKTECVKCHDPHQPLFLQKPVAEARLHPLVHRCRDCHLNRTDETLPRPAEHPAIFQCSYCHKDLAKDFATRTHQKVSCTTCHLFLKESDFAGRIVRNTDPRFCLLCHRAAAFRSSDAPATIEWPAHAQQWDADITDPATPCTNCHADAIHGDNVKARSSTP
jgi:hypothetical protein